MNESEISSNIFVLFYGRNAQKAATAAPNAYCHFTLRASTHTGQRVRVYASPISVLIEMRRFSAAFSCSFQLPSYFTNVHSFSSLACAFNCCSIFHRMTVFSCTSVPIQYFIRCFFSKIIFSHSTNKPKKQLLMNEINLYVLIIRI